MPIGQKASVLTCFVAALATIAIAASTFWVFYSLEIRKHSEHLSDAVSMVTIEHGRTFSIAEELHKEAEAALGRRIEYWRAHPNIQQEFDYRFPVFRDGTRRSNSTSFDGALEQGGAYTYGIAAFIPEGVAESVKKQAELLAAFDVVSRFGESMLFEFDNFYYYTPENALIIFAPNRHDRLIYYREKAPADFSFQDMSFAEHVTPKANPNREMRCTGLEAIVYDTTNRKMTSGCQSPVDVMGVHIGAFGSSLLLDGWLREAIQPREGHFQPFIVETTGEIIAHANLIGETDVEASKKFREEFNAGGLIQAIESESTSVGVLDYPAWKARIAFSKFDGPNWIAVISEPTANVQSSAFAAAAKVASVGVALLFLIFWFLFTQIDRMISRPILNLSKKTTDKKKFVCSKEERERNDELGELARAFEKRDERYFELVETLDTRVDEKTKQLVKARARAEASDSAKSTFLANMSHEIRTPLNGIIGLAEVLEKTELNNRQQNLVQVINRSGDALLRIVNDILDLSKIEAERLELWEEPFELIEIVEDVVGAFEVVARQKGVMVYAEIGENLNEIVIGDKVRLRQVLSNLVANGVKFTDKGQVTLSVRREESSIHGKWKCMIKVSDTGIGMDAEALDTIFGAFQQADHNSTRRANGTGLGLTIAKRLVDLMGGKISVSSAPGNGSVFEVELEFQSTGISAKEDRHRKKALLDDGSNEGRILLVEDNEINQLVVEEMLSDKFEKIEIVENGTDAITRFLEKSYDLILMDIQMPGLDGVGAIEKIRGLETEARLSRTPILVVSANVMEDQIEAYLSVGADGCVAKPFKEAELLHAIESVSEAKDDHQLQLGRKVTKLAG